MTITTETIREESPEMESFKIFEESLQLAILEVWKDPDKCLRDVGVEIIPEQSNEGFDFFTILSFQDWEDLFNGVDIGGLVSDGDMLQVVGEEHEECLRLLEESEQKWLINNGEVKLIYFRSRFEYPGEIILEEHKN